MNMRNLGAAHKKYTNPGSPQLRTSLTGEAVGQRETSDVSPTIQSDSSHSSEEKRKQLIEEARRARLARFDQGKSPQDTKPLPPTAEEKLADKQGVPLPPNVAVFAAIQFPPGPSNPLSREPLGEFAERLRKETPSGQPLLPAEEESCPTHTKSQEPQASQRPLPAISDGSTLGAGDDLGAKKSSHTLKPTEEPHYKGKSRNPVPTDARKGDDTQMRNINSKPKTQELFLPAGSKRTAQDFPEMEGEEDEEDIGPVSYFNGDRIARHQVPGIVKTLRLRKDGFGVWRDKTGSEAEIYDHIAGTWDDVVQAHSFWKNDRGEEVWETPVVEVVKGIREDGWGVPRDHTGEQPPRAPDASPEVAAAVAERTMRRMSQKPSKSSKHLTNRQSREPPSSSNASAPIGSHKPKPVLGEKQNPVKTDRGTSRSRGGDPKTEGTNRPKLSSDPTDMQRQNAPEDEPAAEMRARHENTDSFPDETVDSQSEGSKARKPGKSGKKATPRDDRSAAPDSPLSPATLAYNEKVEKSTAETDEIRARGGGKTLSDEVLDDTNGKKEAASASTLPEMLQDRGGPGPDKPTSRIRAPKPSSGSSKPKDPESKQLDRRDVTMKHRGKEEDRAKPGSQPPVPPVDFEPSHGRVNRKPREPRETSDVAKDADEMHVEEDKPMTERELLELKQAAWNDPRRKKLQYEATGKKPKPKPKDNTAESRRLPRTTPRTLESGLDKMAALPSEYVVVGKDVQRKDGRPMTDEDRISHREQEQAKWNLPRREKLAARLGRQTVEPEIKPDDKPARRARVSPDHSEASQPKKQSARLMDLSDVVNRDGGPERKDGEPLTKVEKDEYNRGLLNPSERGRKEKIGTIPDGVVREKRAPDYTSREALAMRNRGKGPGTSPSGRSPVDDELPVGGTVKPAAQQSLSRREKAAEAAKRARKAALDMVEKSEGVLPIADKALDVAKERGLIGKKKAEEVRQVLEQARGGLDMVDKSLKGANRTKTTTKQPKQPMSERDKRIAGMGDILNEEQDIGDMTRVQTRQRNRADRDLTTGAKYPPEERDIGDSWEERYGNGISDPTRQPARPDMLQRKVDQDTKASVEARKIQEATKLEEARKVKLKQQRLDKLAGKTTGTRTRIATSSKTKPVTEHQYPPTSQGLKTRHNATTSGSRSKSVSRPKSVSAVQSKSTSTTINPKGKGKFRAMGIYIRNAKFYSLFLLIQNVITAVVARQFCVLIVSSGSIATAATSSPAKRAEGDLPPDMEYTNKWLTNNFGSNVDPRYAFILLNIWIGFSVLLSAYLYNAIIDATDNPQRKEKKGFGQRIKGLGRGLKKAPVGILKALSMDRHPSFKNVRRRWGKWTLVRITLFLIQVSTAAITLRITIALNSLVAGAAEPTPSGPDINALSELIKDGAAGSTSGGAFLLLLFVMGCFVLTVTWSWHSLLHPRRDDRRPGRRGGILMNIITLRILKRRNRPNLGPKTYKCVVVAIMFIVTGAFAVCIAWFSEIMRYTADFVFVQDSNVGLVFPFTLFGLFIIPMAWVVIKLEDLVIMPLWRSCRGKK